MPLPLLNGAWQFDSGSFVINVNNQATAIKVALGGVVAKAVRHIH
uniref:Uncharacterized protein n=1 Tax=Polynucleobacter necessarius subsp. necessarius (strain STIR1) TaxID=452638 RepID=B1XTN0_POLNS